MSSEDKHIALVPDEIVVDRAKVDQWAVTLSLIVNNTLRSYDVTAEVSYDPTHLSVSMQTHPGLVAYWTSVQAKLEELLNLSKLNLRRARAEHARNARRHLAATGQRATESSITEILDSSPELVAMEAEAFNVQCRFKQVKGLIEALQARKEMLLQEGQNRIRAWYQEKDLT